MQLSLGEQGVDPCNTAPYKPELVDYYYKKETPLRTIYPCSGNLNLSSLSYQDKTKSLACNLQTDAGFLGQHHLANENLSCLLVSGLSHGRGIHEFKLATAYS